MLYYICTPTQPPRFYIFLIETKSLNMKFLLKILPASVIRAAGKLQFRFPFLKKIINKVGQSLTGEGIIQRGAGKGLYFNATGCNPGFLAGTSEPLEHCA